MLKGTPKLPSHCRTGRPLNDKSENKSDVEQASSLIQSESVSRSRAYNLLMLQVHRKIMSFMMRRYDHHRILVIPRQLDLI